MVTHSILRHALFLGCLPLLCLGCTATALTSRMVHEDPSCFVRLDSYRDDGSSPVRYEHPASWTAEELSAILSRLLLIDRVGLMDSARPPRPVFSSEEIMLLIPVLRNSFQIATPSEWVSFLLATPRGTNLVVTSGGLFLSEARLHVVVANHRTGLGKDSEDLALVRTNPLRSIQGSGGALTFESPRFVMGTQPNWSGGHRASASELVLDHRTFLSFLALPGAMTPGQPARPSQSDSAVAPRPTPDRPAVTPETDSQTVILRLQDDIQRLKKKVEEQEAEIARLKRGTGHTPRSNTGP